jgi:hypothetical protein
MNLHLPPFGREDCGARGEQQSGGFVLHVPVLTQAGDADVLGRVEKYHGLTVEQIQIDNGRSVNLLIEKAQRPLLQGVNLPNGRAEILVATVITDQEMRWSMKNGRDALLSELQKAGVGQFSVVGRKTVVE